METMDHGDYLINIGLHRTNSRLSRNSCSVRSSVQQLLQRMQSHAATRPSRLLGWVYDGLRCVPS